MSQSSPARSHAWIPALATTVLGGLAVALWGQPLLLGVLGLALAVVVGVLAHQVLASRRRAGELAALNQALADDAEQLRRHNETLAAHGAERTTELEELTKSFSHDLKSPLGAILNFTAILEVDHRERWDTDSFDILMRIRRSATRATAMLDGLTRLSRVSRTALDWQVLDMNELARKAFAQARSGPEEDADVELVADPLPEARGDAKLVTEALCHLFDNALKYSRGREKRLVITRGREVGAECIYEVADNGRGFEMQYADKLFGLFECLHPPAEISGSGVGLALVRKIVQRHGGRVWAESEVDRGSRFLFSLPSARVPP